MTVVVVAIDSQSFMARAVAQPLARLLSSQGLPSEACCYRDNAVSALLGLEGGEWMARRDSSIIQSLLRLAERPLGGLLERGARKFLDALQPRAIITVYPLPSLIGYCRSRGIPLIYWSLDDPHIFPPLGSAFARECDYVFTQSRGSLPLYRDEGIEWVEWLPMGYDHQHFFPNGETQRYPIAFVGSYLEDRRPGVERVLAPLVFRFGRNVHTYGYEQPGASWLTLASSHPSVSWEDVNRVYNATKVVVGIHRESERLLDQTLNLRVFEALGSGSFLLSDDARGIEEFFVPGRDLVTVKDGEEAVEMVSYFLENREARERIAQNGHEVARSYHTLAHRARRIEEILRILAT